MNKNINIITVRFWVMLTVICLFILITAYELGVNLGWTISLRIVSISSLVLSIISYVFGFFVTGLWKFTHNFDSLDEREIQLSGKILRLAYAIFTIFVMIIIYVFVLFDIQLSVILGAGLLLFAHLLPGAILAFSEKDLRL